MKESFLSIKEIFHIGNGKINALVFLAVLAVLSSFLEIYSIQYMQSLSEVFSTSVTNDLFQIGFICAKFLMLIVLSTIVRNYFCFRVSIFSNDIIKNVRDKAYSKLIDMEYELAIIHDNAFYINLIDNNVNRLSLIFSTSFFYFVFRYIRYSVDLLFYDTNKYHFIVYFSNWHTAISFNWQHIGI